MKRASSLWVSIIVSTVLVAAALALGLRQQSRIATLREEQTQLTRQLAFTLTDQRAADLLHALERQFPRRDPPRAWEVLQRGAM